LISESPRSARAFYERHQPPHDFGALADDVCRFTNILLQVKERQRNLNRLAAAALATRPRLNHHFRQVRQMQFP